MNQSLEYMRHRARMDALGAKPLTWHQFVSYTDKMEIMK